MELDGFWAAPLTRGWTQGGPPHRLASEGCPAHAGMDPSGSGFRVRSRRLPRSRGDGPGPGATPRPTMMAAPLTRGWTLAPIALVADPAGCPAHAGMDRSRRAPRRRRRGLPRSRGDGPSGELRRISVSLAAPLTRGWTRPRRGAYSHRDGCPAHAGMDRLIGKPAARVDRLPRSRGDGPPARNAWCAQPSAAPLTRGWTPLRAARPLPRPGCPAHAGMDPRSGSRSDRWTRLPRSRGDGPRYARRGSGSSPAAPLTRGWTRAGGYAQTHDDGCPAHAGMDPPDRRGSRRASWLPRSRGDGPRFPGAQLSGSTAAPLTRGWTLRRAKHSELRQGCPAHAGMDPRPAVVAPAVGGLPRSRGDGPSSFVE